MKSPILIALGLMLGLAAPASGQPTVCGSGGSASATQDLILNGSDADNFGARQLFNRNGSTKGALGTTGAVLGGSSNGLILYSVADDIDLWAGGLPTLKLKADGSAGLGTSDPLGRLHVGNLADPAGVSTNAGILFAEDISGSDTHGTHAFSDSSKIDQGTGPGGAGTYAHASYDARPRVVGTSDYDHFVGFQAYPLLDGTGRTDCVYGFVSGGQISAGRVGSYIGLLAGTPTVIGTGVVENSFGVFIAGPGVGTSLNYAIFSLRTDPSFLNGSLSVKSISVDPHTPASSTDTGEAGTITWDGSYVYVCVATNTWKRAAISTW